MLKNLFLAKQDKDKEFATQLFERKLTLYQDHLNALFEADDDNVLW